MLRIYSEKAMATHSSTLAWKNPMDGGAWKAAVHGVAEGWTRLSDFTFTFTFTFMHWRRKWQPTPVFFPGESKGRGSLACCDSWGHKESDTTERLNWKRSVICFYKTLSEVVQLCPTLCNPMDCSLPGSSVHGIFQARILEWVAISFYRISAQPRDWTQASCIVGRCFTIWATREVHWQVGINLSGFLP